MNLFVPRTSILIACMAGLVFFDGLREVDAQTVDFNRHIQPILSEHCYTCHGPDEGQRQAELRLDREEQVLAKARKIVIPGDVERSELYQRIISDDPDHRMPPEDSGILLSQAQVSLIQQWIAQGAAWRQHWSFIKPLRPQRPSVDMRHESRNPIDDFVARHYERLGLSAAEQADRVTLARRLSFDLTGLPPSLLEVDAFLADEAPGAYERLVERLLASPHFGERFASVWLDAARYADTSGYQNDGPRDMWRWRDWVIDAFNRSLPFDRFTIEQLAGDMLPDATLDQRIASGFNRNHRGNAEGGIIPEEYAVEYVVDRVDTTSTVWLGLTMGCARCHDHKYDPLSQREFYSFYAYFNNIPEHGRAIKEGNSPPFIKAPNPRQKQALADWDERISALTEAWESLSSTRRSQQQAWEAETGDQSLGFGSIDDGLVSRYPLDDAAQVARDKTENDSETKPATFEVGVLDRALVLRGDGAIEAGNDIGNFGYFDEFTLACWVRPLDHTGTLISRMTPVARGSGYYLHLQDGYLQVNLVKRWLDDSVRVQSRDRLAMDEWHHVTMTYDGTRLASGIRLYVDGVEQALDVHLDSINQTFTTDQPFRIGGGASSYTGMIDEVRVYDRALTSDEVVINSCRRSINEILAVDPAQRSAAERLKLTTYFVRTHADEDLQSLDQQRRRLTHLRTEFFEQLPTVMVMQELPHPRPTHLLHRGQYDQPRERVAMRIPAALSTDEQLPSSRLQLAEWIASGDNPLTARVAVNRIWQMIFGQGLVRTAEDFGVQGERPSHPELLDWLAVELVHQEWDLKSIVRAIVCSATYQQASFVDQETRTADPGNTWLTRGPRVRLSAAMIRDQALAASGLLQATIGGPSVKPYQPEGLWKEIATTTDYVQSHGTDLYRRSLYTYWKRTVVPPVMSAFDASSRETCVVRQDRTNTPLQALATLNETAFVEAARVLAEDVMTAHSEPNDRIVLAFRRVLSRHPSDEELDVLRLGLDDHRQHYRAHPELAKKLVGIGEAERFFQGSDAELAAYTTLASLIFNLDQTVTKE